MPQCKECDFHYMTAGVGEQFAKKLCCKDVIPVRRHGDLPACKDFKAPTPPVEP